MKRAKESFATGGEMFAAGSELDDDHPVIAGREHLFDHVDDKAKHAAPSRTARKAAR